MEAKEMRESYKEREQERNERINKMERQLVKIYEKYSENAYKKLPPILTTNRFV